MEHDPITQGSAGRLSQRLDRIESKLEQALERLADLSTKHAVAEPAAVSLKDEVRENSVDIASLKDSRTDMAATARTLWKVVSAIGGALVVAAGGLWAKVSADHDENIMQRQDIQNLERRLDRMETKP